TVTPWYRPRRSRRSWTKVHWVTAWVRSMPTSKKPLVPTEPGAQGVVIEAVPLKAPHRFTVFPAQSTPVALAAVNPPVGQGLRQPALPFAVQAALHRNSDTDATIPPLVKDANNKTSPSLWPGPKSPFEPHVVGCLDNQNPGWTYH